MLFWSAACVQAIIHLWWGRCLRSHDAPSPHCCLSSFYIFCVHASTKTKSHKFTCSTLSLCFSNLLLHCPFLSISWIHDHSLWIYHLFDILMFSRAGSLRLFWSNPHDYGHVYEITIIHNAIRIHNHHNISTAWCLCVWWTIWCAGDCRNGSSKFRIGFENVLEMIVLIFMVEPHWTINDSIYSS